MMNMNLQVKKRFPSLGHLSEAGIITEQERKIIEDLDEKCIQVTALNCIKSGSDNLCQTLTDCIGNLLIKKHFPAPEVLADVGVGRSHCAEGEERGKN